MATPVGGGASYEGDVAYPLPRERNCPKIAQGTNFMVNYRLNLGVFLRFKVRKALSRTVNMQGYN